MVVESCFIWCITSCLSCFHTQGYVLYFILQIKIVVATAFAENPPYRAWSTGIFMLSLINSIFHYILDSKLRLKIKDKRKHFHWTDLKWVVHLCGFSPDISEYLQMNLDQFLSLDKTLVFPNPAFFLTASFLEQYWH